jgi:7-cyano-7-deazaguanine synthase in queuosine biosynthesis
LVGLAVGLQGGVSNGVNHGVITMKDLKCFDKVIVGKPDVRPDSIFTKYTLESRGKSVSSVLRCKYREPFDRASLQRYASLISTVPAINEGLFADEIILEYELTPASYQFFSTMLEKSAREIFVHEFLSHPCYIRKELLPQKEDVQAPAARPRAEFLPAGLDSTKYGPKENIESKVIVSSSGGKESLLCYGLMKEVGAEVYPVFLNESGGHWKTAITAYREFQRQDPNTKKVWHNLDQLFLFLVRNMSILDQDSIEHRSRTKGHIGVADPINLFSFAYYQFLMLPLAEKHKIGHLCFGNEYDDPTEILEGHNKINGIEYYPNVYDQSPEYMSHLNPLLSKEGLDFGVWSPVGPITGFQVEQILGTRYPSLLPLQRSCHHTHMEGEVSMPCGTCQKCKRIISFAVAQGIDYHRLGYSDSQVAALPGMLASLHLDHDEQEHLFFKLRQKGYDVQGKRHDHVEMMHFDGYGTHVNDIPGVFREQLYGILLNETSGAVFMDQHHQWRPFDLPARLMDQPMEAHSQ